MALVKFLNGAWPDDINKVIISYVLRKVFKDAWQVLSEELGDDNAAKNHVTVFIELLKGVRLNLPPSYSEDFVHERHGL